jgi:hypothetical protein
MRSVPIELSAQSASGNGQGINSVHVLAAIYRKSRPGDKIALVAGEKHDPPSNIPGRSEPTYRYASDDLLEHVGRHGAYHFGIDVTRRNRVDCDAKPRNFLSRMS